MIRSLKVFGCPGAGLVAVLKREARVPEEAQAARILLTRIKNERLGEGGLSPRFCQSCPSP